MMDKTTEILGALKARSVESHHKNNVYDEWAAHIKSLRTQLANTEGQRDALQGTLATTLNDSASWEAQCASYRDELTEALAENAQFETLRGPRSDKDTPIYSLLRSELDYHQELIDAYSKLMSSAAALTEQAHFMEQTGNRHAVNYFLKNLPARARQIMDIVEASVEETKAEKAYDKYHAESGGMLSNMVNDVSVKRREAVRAYTGDKSDG